MTEHVVDVGTVVLVTHQHQRGHDEDAVIGEVRVAVCEDDLEVVGSRFEHGVLLLDAKESYGGARELECFLEKEGLLDASVGENAIWFFNQKSYEVVLHEWRRMRGGEAFVL